MRMTNPFLPGLHLLRLLWMLPTPPQGGGLILAELLSLCYIVHARTKLQCCPMRGT